MKYIVNVSLLRDNRKYRLLFSGQFISFMGTMITGVAVPYQVYHITGSTLMVGLISLFQLVPLLFTALLGGILADRHNRRKLILLTEILMAMGSLLLAINSMLPHPSLWFLFLVAVIVSGINGLHRPALDSIVQQIVAKKDFAMVATLNNFIFSIGLIAGPAIAGLMIARFGLVATFMVDFGTFLFSLLMVVLIGQVSQPLLAKAQSILGALKEGFSYAFSRQELVGTYLVDFIAMIFGMPMALFPAIAQAHGGPEILGLLYSMPAVGSFCVSFFGGWVSLIKRYGVAIAISASIWGIAIILFGLGLKINLILALFFLAIAGAADAVSGIFRSTLWNQTIPTELRGRLSGIEMISYLSGPKLGDTEAGLVAALFGVTASIVSGGIFCVIGVVLSCFYLPKFWRYNSDNLSVDNSICNRYDNA